MRSLVRGLFLALTALISGSLLVNSSCASEADIRELGEAEQITLTSSNEFGLNLFKEITRVQPGSNVFISPLSVSMALAMTLNGTEGVTKDSMAQTLLLGDRPLAEIDASYSTLLHALPVLDTAVVLDIANSIWYRQDFKFRESFIETGRKFFDAEVRALDFGQPQSAQAIDGWVGEKTKGKITEIAPRPLPPTSVMFLINAIYFKGNWSQQFKVELTLDDKFTLANGSTKDVKMMQQGGKYKYLENDLFQAAVLPYGDSVFNMTILLPKPDKTVTDILGRLDLEYWEVWLGGFREIDGTVYLPKFKVEYSLDLKDVLSRLGMTIAFDPSRADFSAMYDRTQSAVNLYIGQVKHKTFIEVNEEGTEAAAVTSVGMMATSVGPKEHFIMRIDRPFVFVISESKTRSVLFIGTLADPTL